MSALQDAHCGKRHKKEEELEYKLINQIIFYFLEHAQIVFGRMLAFSSYMSSFDTLKRVKTRQACSPARVHKTQDYRRSTCPVLASPRDAPPFDEVAHLSVEAPPQLARVLPATETP